MGEDFQLVNSIYSVLFLHICYLSIVPVWRIEV